MALVSKPIRLTEDVIEMIENLAQGNESPNKTLRRILEEGVEQNNPALAAIQYVLDTNDEPMTFLECWNEGDFEALREEWDDVPDEVFIGADPQFKPGKKKKGK